MLPALDRKQRRKDAEQRRLAAAIGPEKDENLARLDPQAQPGQRRRSP